MSTTKSSTKGARDRHVGTLQRDSSKATLTRLSVKHRSVDNDTNADGESTSNATGNDNNAAGNETGRKSPAPSSRVPRYYFDPTVNTYRTEPETFFSVAKVERVVQRTLEERLKKVKYEPVYCKGLCQELSAQIMDRLKSLDIRRFKLVAIVSIGSLKERPGIQFGSRCLWNQDSDNFASVKYVNGSLFAVAMVYGLYFE